MIHFLCLWVVVVVLCLSVFVEGVVDDSVMNAISELKKDVYRKERKMLKSEEDPVPVAVMYYQLGMKIQESWLNKLIPGTVILDALEAFDKATTYAANSTNVLFPILLNKGILFRMMSRGEESLQAYDQAESQYMYPVDAATIHYNRADALLMMGNVNQSIRSFEKSLELIPCKTERYYGYISALKEQNLYDRSQWEEKLIALRKTEKQCIFHGKQSEKQNDYDDDYEDDYLPFVYPKRSFLFPDLQSGLQSWKHSDFYYALSIVFEKLKDFPHSFQYLHKAKTIDKKAKLDNSRNSGGATKGFNRKEVIENKNSTVKIFTKEMLSSFPDVSSLATTIPIFVIGMMRSGSTLMETILDSHPNIRGMGEDSFFNANLTFLRNSIVEVSTEYPQEEAFYALEDLLLEYGDHTVEKMKESVLDLYYQEENNKSDDKEKNTKKSGKPEEMKHIVDKMLFNYKNIGNETIFYFLFFVFYFSQLFFQDLFIWFIPELSLSTWFAIPWTLSIPVTRINSMILVWSGHYL
jgi:tetratricopeptide (TPR) repeat protein